jgi:DnaJ-class molecular chaperone
VRSLLGARPLSGAWRFPHRERGGNPQGFPQARQAASPDANKGDKKSEEKFKQVSAAFDILGDADKRKKFDAGEIDADGRETMRGGFGGGGGPFGPGFAPGGAAAAPAAATRSERSTSTTCSATSWAAIAARGRGARGGGGGGFGGFSPKGADVRARLDIDLEEAIKGGKKRVAFSDGRTIDVTIPAGAQEGQTLRLKGQGSPGRGGQGDALIELAIKPHPIYRPENGALVMDLPISRSRRGLDAGSTLTVPKGSNSGAKLRPAARRRQGAALFARGDHPARRASLRARTSARVWSTSSWPFSQTVTMASRQPGSGA